MRTHKGEVSFPGGRLDEGEDAVGAAPREAIEWVAIDPDNPLEVRSFDRTLGRWKEQIVVWHRSGVSKGPTEAADT